MSIQFRNPETGDYEGRIGINVYPAMTHTVEYLLKQNMVQAEDLVTRIQLHPSWYEETDEYFEKYGVAYGDAYEDPASIGVIGGADGPTEVFVTAG